MKTLHLFRAAAAIVAIASIPALGDEKLTFEPRRR